MIVARGLGYVAATMAATLLVAHAVRNSLVSYRVSRLITNSARRAAL